MRYTDPMLEALRAEADPQADGLIAGLAAAGSVDAVNQVLRRLLENDQAVPAALPEGLRQWLTDTGRIPSWANQRRLERGEAFFAEHGVLISLILATDSLVECYAARKGVKVLTATYRLAANPYRRIAETAQFVLLVMAPGGLSHTGQGIRAIQKIRLLHAAIRYLIKQHGQWNEAEWGVPINQEDLAGTLMAFSYLVVRDLRKLGVQVSDAEAEEYLYCWRAIGEMLGVRPSVLPVSMAEAEQLTAAIFRRHHGPSPEGVAMTRALLELHVRMVPGTLFDGVVPALVRYLAGDQVADWMEVPHTPWDRVLGREELVRLIGRAETETEGLRKGARHLGMAFLNATAIAMTGYERAAFTIPTQLRQHWGLSEDKNKKNK